MRSFIVTLLLSVGSIAAAQPVIENVPGVNDPVKVKIVSSNYTNGKGNAFLYIQQKDTDGRIVHFASHRIIELVDNGGVSGSYAYNLYSKNGTLMATHSISKAVYPYRRIELGKFNQGVC